MDFKPRVGLSGDASWAERSSTAHSDILQLGDQPYGPRQLLERSPAGVVVKVRLSDFTRVGALTLNSGENGLYSAVIDPTGDHAYFGTTASNPGVVVKVRLSDFTRVGALTLNSGENKLLMVVIDPAGGYAYFGTGTEPGIVVRIDLGRIFVYLPLVFR